MKKLICMMAMLLWAATFAAAEEMPEIFAAEDFVYVVLADGTAEITDYTGYASSLNVPEQLDGVKVTSIGNKAFDGCKMLTDVAIPEGIGRIGGRAFIDCESLGSISLPNSVTEIGVNPFSDCDVLANIIVADDHPTLAVTDGMLFSKPDKRLVCYLRTNSGFMCTVPEGIEIIGAYAFADCNNLRMVTLPSSITAIGDYAFFSCENLRNIVIPHGITAIAPGTFSNCKSLISVSLPGGITSIGEWAFNFCESLQTIHLPDSLISIGERAFRECIALDRIIIPEGVKFIESFAFSDCESLTSVTLPASVKSIGEGAFFLASRKLTVTVPRGSYAAQYCQENEHDYTYRLSVTSYVAIGLIVIVAGLALFGLIRFMRYGKIGKNDSPPIEKCE